MRIAMKKLILFTIVCSLLIMSLVRCDKNLLNADTVVDPNNPSVQQVLTNATRPQIQNVITGIEIRNRQYAGLLIPLLGSLGREVWFIDSIDSRFLEEWLGIVGNAETDPDFFADASVYDTPYTAVRQTNLMLEVLANTDVLTEQESNGVSGFTKTIQGFQLFIPLLSQFENGIRVDVEDPQAPGPFLEFDEALSRIRGILDEGFDELNSSGDVFFYELSDGFSEFNTPATMAQLNRAIAARAAVYAEDWQGAIDALDQSFLDLREGEENLNRGAFLSYGDPPDIFNPLFYPRNATPDDIMVVHPSVIEDTLAGDLRIDRKFFLRDTPLNNSNVPREAAYQDNRFANTSSGIPMIRNEELVLIFAEARMQRNQGTDISDAIDAINIVRNTWNLPDYTGPTDQQSLIDEILLQRRYSLWAEFGHRWIDARRYDRLDRIDEEDKLTGTIFQQFARPQSEINFEDFIL